MTDRKGWYVVAGVAVISILALVAPFPALVAGGPAAAAPQAPSAERKLAVQGPLSFGPSDCDDDGDFIQPVSGANQIITIKVTARKSQDYPWYSVSVHPVCAQVSKNGSLTFKLDVTAVDDWQPDHAVDLEFLVPSGSAPHVKGPYGRYRGVPKKRGRYEGAVTTERDLVIPKEAMEAGVKGKKWKGSYSVTIYDKYGDHLGEVDPGVMVVDNP